jgi:superoxide dismutase
MLNQAIKSSIVRKTMRAFSTAAAATPAPAKIVQTPLPYALNDLEPVLTQQQMDYHYNRHHKTYVVKYNEKIDQIEQAMTK